MTPGRGLVAAAALICAVAAAGCGFGAGPASEGTATLTVTRDYGSKTLVQASDQDPPSSETVIRLLDREADITTRYGGGFVQSIGGVEGTESGGRRYDWFFYVNGIESPVGSAEVRVRGGDRIWWDYRDWTAAMRVPAVVGSWPEPFAQASAEGAPKQVTIECAGPGDPCQKVAERLGQAGVDTAMKRLGTKSTNADALRILVGPWAAVRRHPAAALQGPGTSGVFATFKGAHGRYELVLTDQGAQPRLGFRAHAGLVAAVRRGNEPPTWLVTGTDLAGVRKAAGLLDHPDLRNHYAVAAPPQGAPIPLPVSPTVEGGT